MATTAPLETEDKPKPDGGGEEVPDIAADDPPGEKNGVIAMDDGPAKPPAFVKSDVLTREEVDELLIEAIAQARVNKRGQKDVLESVLKKSKYAPSVTLSLEVDGVEQAVHEGVSVVLPKEVFSSSTAEFRELIHLALDGLSETEKNALKTHLPKECQDEQVVHDVIRKDDFHFGNPVARMHKMLIGGKLHPDVWLMRQKKIALQKQHYVERVRARHNALVHRMRALYRDANRRTTAKPLAPPATKKAKPVLRLNDDDSDDAAEHMVKRLPPPKRTLPKMKIEESLFLTLLDIFQSSPDKTEAFDNIVARVQQHATITDKTPENLSVSEFVEAALKLLSGPTGKLKGFLSLNSTSNRWEWNGKKPRTSQLIRRELLFLKSGAASDAEKLGDCDDSSQDETERVKPPKAKKAKKSKSESGKIVENGASSSGAAATGADEAPKKESVSKKSERKVVKQPETPALPPSTPEEREEFQKQEQLRYNSPGQAFEYSINGFRTVVGPLKKPSAGSKPREHPALKSDRPAHVTFLTLVRDAASRLPGGIGTRQDVTTLFVDSQYVNPSATKEQISTVVSGALDRLRDEVDTCVKYNQERKLWQYMHKDRKIEDFEPIDWTAAAVKKKKAAPKKKAPKKDNTSTSTTKSAGKTSRPTSPNIDFAAAVAASIAGDNTSHLSGMFPPGQQSPMLMPSASASAASASVSASDLLHKSYSVDSASSVSGPTIAQSFHSRFSPTHPGHPGSLLGMHEYSQHQQQLQMQQMQQMQQSQLQHPHPHMQQLPPQRSVPQTASLPAISQIPGFGDHWVSSPAHHSPSRPDTQPFGMTGPSLVTEEEQARQNNHAAIRQALYQRQAHQQEQHLLQQQQMLQQQQFEQQTQAESQQRALPSNQPRANPEPSEK